MKTRKLKPEDKHVTRKELLAELVLIARAADASISQLRTEFEARLPVFTKEDADAIDNSVGCDCPASEDIDRCDAVVAKIRAAAP